MEHKARKRKRWDSETEKAGEPRQNLIRQQ
jgi:hypothetical protein